MSKKEIDVIHELKMSALSADKVTEHTGQIYASIAKLYAAAAGNKIITGEIDLICHHLGLDYQEFQAAQARVKVMGAALEQKSLTIAEITEEARNLAKLLSDQATAEAVVPVYTNGHKRVGRR